MSVRLSVRAIACVRQNIVVDMMVIIILNNISQNFIKLTTLTHFGTEIKVSDFGIKGSKFKVTVK